MAGREGRTGRGAGWLTPRGRPGLGRPAVTAGCMGHGGCIRSSTPLLPAPARPRSRINPEPLRPPCQVTYNFVSGEEGIPSYSAAMAAQQRVFIRALQAASPDFKPTNFHGVDAPGQAEMAISTNAVGERFGCLALTLELPFKDVQAHPGEGV